MTMLIGQHLCTRSIIGLPIVCSALRPLPETKAWCRLLGRVLAPTPAELCATLQRAAVEMARKDQWDEIEKVNRHLRGRTGAPRNAKPGYPHPLAPRAADIRAHRRLGFGALSRGLVPPVDVLLPYRPYLAAVTAHPPPTRSQLVSFADYLSSAHSWYKHLDNPPGNVFHVFFDPCAMMMHTNGEVKEITNGETWHYSMMKTRDYRKRFGICSFEQREPLSERTPFHIRDVDGTRLLLPPRVSSGADSLVLLSAMCHDNAGPRWNGGTQLRADELRSAAASLTEHARLYDSRGHAEAAARTLTLAQEIDGVEMGDPTKRRELLSDVYDKQRRRERAYIVDALTRQAQAIWGVPKLADA